MKSYPGIKIMLVSAFGFIGFLAGIFILFGNDIFSKGDRSIFHEIEYEPANIIRPYLTDSVNALQTRLDRIIDEKRKIPKSKSNDDASIMTVDLLDTLKARTKTRLDAYKKLNSLTYLKDSSAFRQLNSIIRFELSLNNLDSIERVFNKDFLNNIDSLRFQIFPTATNDIIAGQATLRNISFQNDIAFFTKYPSVGLWAVFILVFCSFCIAFLVICYHLWTKIKETTELNTKAWGYWGLSIIIVLLLLFTGFLWKCSFYDGEPVRNIYFMKDFTSTVQFTIFIGYISGGLCMAGCLYTAGWLSYVEEKLTTAANLDLVYENLRDIFNTFFTLSAIVLSLMVLTTGTLYNVVHHLPFVRLLADDWGFEPAPADFVYLYGGLHSIFLILIYLPGRWRFIPRIKEPAPRDAAANDKWYNVVKKPFGKLGDLLVASSPLIASLMQSLLDLLFD
jgi:hypothetical protein